MIGRFLHFTAGFCHPARLRIARCLLDLAGEGEGNQDEFVGSAQLLLLIFRLVFAGRLGLVITFAHAVFVLLALFILVVFVIGYFFLVVLVFLFRGIAFFVADSRVLVFLVLAFFGLINLLRLIININLNEFHLVMCLIIRVLSTLFLLRFYLLILFKVIP